MTRNTIVGQNGNGPAVPILSAARAAEVKAPIAEARGLPNNVYVDEAAFRAERDQVVATGWACLGFAADLTQNGYVWPVDLMGLPLLVVRDRAGELAVFHNVCRHRGVRLVESAGPIKTVIRCPYHSWSYSLAGDLVATPHIGGVDQHEADGFDRRKYGLLRVRSTVWMDMIFVNLSGDGPELADHLAPLLARWREFVAPDDLADLQFAPDCAFGLEVTANWKLAVENFCEAYHLPWIHPGLNSYSPLKDHFDIMIDDFGGGQGSRAYKLAEREGYKFPTFPNWPAAQQNHAEYVAIFPNLLLGLQVDHVFAMLIEPTAVNATSEHVRIAWRGDAATSPDFAEMRAVVKANWMSVFEEDVGVVEAMQKGRASPAYDGGVFSPVMDRPTHHFHRWIAARLAG